MGAGTKSDLDDAQFNYDTAVSDLAEAESDVAETVITAPMSGIVVGEPKSSGTMAVQGTSNPTVIMNIADSTQKQIRAKVDETDIGNIRVGEEATFTVDAYTGNLDTTSTKEIMGIFETLHERHHTIILVTHEPEIAACADRQLLMCDGRITRDEGKGVSMDVV